MNPHAAIRSVGNDAVERRSVVSELNLRQTRNALARGLASVLQHDARLHFVAGAFGTGGSPSGRSTYRAVLARSLSHAVGFSLHLPETRGTPRLRRHTAIVWMSRGVLKVFRECAACRRQRRRPRRGVPGPYTVSLPTGLGEWRVRLETLRCLDHASQKGFTEFKSRLASRKPMSCKHLSLTTSRSA